MFQKQIVKQTELIQNSGQIPYLPVRRLTLLLINPSIEKRIQPPKAHRRDIFSNKFLFFFNNAPMCKKTTPTIPTSIAKGKSER